jgi:hypothetical protein
VTLQSRAKLFEAVGGEPRRFLPGAAGDEKRCKCWAPSKKGATVDLLSVILAAHSLPHRLSKDRSGLVSRRRTSPGGIDMSWPRPAPYPSKSRTHARVISVSVSPRLLDQTAQELSLSIQRRVSAVQHRPICSSPISHDLCSLRRGDLRQPNLLIQVCFQVAFHRTGLRDSDRARFRQVFASMRPCRPCAA